MLLQLPQSDGADDVVTEVPEGSWHVRKWRFFFLGLGSVTLLTLMTLYANNAEDMVRRVDLDPVNEWEEIPGIHGIIDRAQRLEQPKRELSDLFYGGSPSEMPWLRTECVIDVVQATSYLGTAVVFLYKAIKYDGLQCPDNSPVGCAISVSGFIASMFWLASYLSLAASSCAEAMNSNALCGADWMALTADFAEVANAGAGIRQNCHFHNRWLNFTGNVPGWQAFVIPGAPPTGQAVDKIKFIREARRNRNFDISQCVFDTTNAASFVVRSILQLRSAARACINPRNCAIDIMDVISSFGWISRFLSMAASDCVKRGNQKALCSADISNLVAALSNGPASGMSTISDCDRPLNPLNEIMHEPTA